MNRVGYFFAWFDATDANRISNSANTKRYTSICIDFQYLVLRPVAWARIMDESRRRSRRAVRPGADAPKGPLPTQMMYGKHPRLPVS
jgi:hypothetical protein